jgi:hypothetical protein
MLSGQLLRPALMKRPLAGLIVLSLSLMSFAVENCEASCLFDGVRWADGSARSDMPTRAMASLKTERASERNHLAAPTGMSRCSSVSRLESKSCVDNELCKEDPATVMLPTGRTEFRNVRWIAVGVTFAPTWSTVEFCSNRAESPPSKEANPHLFSMRLRV